jgi:hypothetical protein
MSTLLQAAASGSWPAAFALAVCAICATVVAVVFLYFMHRE